MVDIKKFKEIDLYGLIGVDISANVAEIRKSYRKKALQCHPDKNPDNPKAAELFHELSQALEILLDVSARAAYDRILSAKKAAELRHKQLDGKRQKLKTDLEERERQAQAGVSVRGYKSNKTPEELFKEEIDRLRKEGSRLLEEEQELMRKHLQDEADLMQKPASSTSWDSSKHRIKIKWNASKEDAMNGGYTEEILRKYLNKYGDIVALVLSPKKTGSALVEFTTLSASEMAISYEKGNLDNPVSLCWIGDAPKSRKGTSSTVTDTDFESLVLRQLRQAEERKKLIDQMMKDDLEKD